MSARKLITISAFLLLCGAAGFGSRGVFSRSDPQAAPITKQPERPVLNSALVQVQPNRPASERFLAILAAPENTNWAAMAGAEPNELARLAILTRWANVDPSAAWRYLTQARNGVQPAHSETTTVLMTWARTDPESALKASLHLPAAATYEKGFRDELRWNILNMALPVT